MSTYIQVNQKTAGPFEEHAVIAWLQGGRLSTEVLACRHGGSEWQPLRTVLSTPARRAAPQIIEKQTKTHVYLHPDQPASVRTL